MFKNNYIFKENFITYWDRNEDACAIDSSKRDLNKLISHINLNYLKDFGHLNQCLTCTNSTVDRNNRVIGFVDDRTSTRNEGNCDDNLKGSFLASVIRSTTNSNIIIIKCLDFEHLSYPFNQTDLRYLHESMQGQASLDIANTYTIHNHSPISITNQLCSLHFRNYNHKIYGEFTITNITRQVNTPSNASIIFESISQSIINLEPQSRELYDIKRSSRIMDSTKHLPYACSYHNDSNNIPHNRIVHHLRSSIFLDNLSMPNLDIICKYAVNIFIRDCQIDKLTVNMNSI